MGADIHMIAQTKIDNQWITIDSNFYGDRNYALFSILTNGIIRNYFNIKNPIAIPKGLPTDFPIDEILSCQICYNSSDLEECKIHFPFNLISSYECEQSYLSLKELKLFNWDTPIFMGAIIPLDGYRKWDHKSPPYPYCQGVIGGNTRVIDMTEVLYDTNPSNNNIYVKVNWVETFAEASGNFYIEKLSQLGKMGKPEDVRIVFGFDQY